MALLCPGCRSELTPEANMCGVCLRPRDRNEVFRGIRQLQEEQKAVRRRPKIIAGVVLALAAAGGGAYKFGPQIHAFLNPPRVAAPTPAPAAPVPEPAPAASGSLPSQPASGSALPAGEPAPPAMSLKNDLPPELARAYARKAAGQEPAAEEADTWTFKGQVYDLLTLKPVRGAKLVFSHKGSGKAHSVKTGADGRYKVALPPGGEAGYQLEVSHPLYRPSYLEETEPPYKRQSEARRVDAARLIINSEVLHVPLTMPEGASETVFDAVLSPLPD